MGAIASQIASLAIVYSAVYSDADQRKHQSSASLAFVRGIHRGPVNSPHKWPVTRKMFPFDDVIRNGKIWNHPDWRKASFNFINCSFILIFIWGQMVWNYHVCTVIVVKTDLKTHKKYLYLCDSLTPSQTAFRLIRIVFVFDRVLNRFWKLLALSTNPCCAKIIWTLKIYLKCISFFNTQMTQVVEILPCWTLWPVCKSYSTPWLLMTRRHNGPGHRQPWY